MPNSKYTVEGVDRQSGLSTRLVVTTLSAELAAVEARSRGMTVERVLQHDPTGRLVPREWSTPSPTTSDQDPALLTELVRLRECVQALQQQSAARPRPITFWTIVWAIIVAPLIAAAIVGGLWLLAMVVVGAFDAAIV